MQLVIRRQNLGQRHLSGVGLESADPSDGGRRRASARERKFPCRASSAWNPTRACIGAPFMVMEQLPGRILPQSPNYNKEGWLAEMPADDRGRVWRGCLEMLARIHGCRSVRVRISRPAAARPLRPSIST